MTESFPSKSHIGWWLVGVYLLAGLVYSAVDFVNGRRLACDPAEDLDTLDVQSGQKSWATRLLEFAQLCFGLPTLWLCWPVILLWQIWPRRSR
jgi:hypothetical protein